MEDRREGTLRRVEQGKTWEEGAIRCAEHAKNSDLWDEMLGIAIYRSKITLYSLVQHLYSKLFVGSYSFRNLVYGCSAACNIGTYYAYRDAK